MTRFKGSSLASVLLGAALALAVAQGCGSSNDDNVRPPDVNAGGSKSTGGSGTKGGSSSTSGKSGNAAGSGDTGEGGAPAQGGTAGTSGSAGKGGSSTSSDAGSGNEGGAPPIPTCDKPETGADGCFNCPKDKDVEQWLNRCTDGDCVPFPNKNRLPKLNADGSLPKLPT